MEDLRNVMRVIDENSHKLSEGDYLTLCNLLRKIYNHKQKEEWSTLVDYEQFDLFVPGERDDVLDHFYDHFYNESIANEEAFLRCQLGYLENELNNHKPIKRVTKYVKYNAILEYCRLNNVRLRHYDEEHLRAYLDDHYFDIGDLGTPFEKGVKKMYKSYIALENRYRSIYTTAINRRIHKIYGWLVNLDEL